MIQVGDRYYSALPIEVDVWLAVEAPATIINSSILPAEEIFTVVELDIYGRICCDPQNYAALHDHFVSPEERERINNYCQRECYKGYTLLISEEIIYQHCQQLPR